MKSALSNKYGVSSELVTVDVSGKHFEKVKYLIGFANIEKQELLFSKKHRMRIAHVPDTDYLLFFN